MHLSLTAKGDLKNNNFEDKTYVQTKNLNAVVRVK
jgi:hypothetical protein